MNIAMIGAGNVGSALARASVRAGHAVMISDEKHPGRASDVATATGASAAKSNADAISQADVVILAVPFEAVRAILEALHDQLDGKVLVDVTNRFAPEELNGPSNAEQIQQWAGRVPVVKAFNTVFASHQDDPNEDGIQLDGFVAGDDPHAKRMVLTLVESLGFRPIDAGSLAMARALEGMGTLNISLNMTYSWPWRTAWKLLGPTA